MQERWIADFSVITEWMVRLGVTESEYENKDKSECEGKNEWLVWTPHTICLALDTAEVAKEQLIIEHVG